MAIVTCCWFFSFALPYSCVAVSIFHCVVGIIWHLIGSWVAFAFGFALLLLLLPLLCICIASVSSIATHCSSTMNIYQAQHVFCCHRRCCSFWCCCLPFFPFFLLLPLLLRLFGLLALFPFLCNALFCFQLLFVSCCCFSCYCCCCACCCYCCCLSCCCCALVNFSTHHCIIFWRARQPENGNTQICAFDATFFLFVCCLPLPLPCCASAPLRLTLSLSFSLLFPLSLAPSPALSLCTFITCSQPAWLIADELWT